MEDIDDFIEQYAPEDGMWVAVEEEDGDLSIEQPNLIKNEMIHEMRRAEEAGDDLFNHGEYESSEKYSCEKCAEEYWEQSLCHDCLCCDVDHTSCCDCNLPRCPCCHRAFENRNGDEVLAHVFDHSNTAWCYECNDMAQEQREYYSDVERDWRNSR